MVFTMQETKTPIFPHTEADEAFNQTMNAAPESAIPTTGETQAVRIDAPVVSALGAAASAELSPVGRADLAGSQTMASSGIDPQAREKAQMALNQANHRPVDPTGWEQK